MEDKCDIYANSLPFKGPMEIKPGTARGDLFICVNQLPAIVSKL